jgi:hypothetical protein
MQFLEQRRRRSGGSPFTTFLSVGAIVLSGAALVQSYQGNRMATGAVTLAKDAALAYQDHQAAPGTAALAPPLATLRTTRLEILNETGKVVAAMIAHQDGVLFQLRGQGESRIDLQTAFAALPALSVRNAESEVDISNNALAVIPLDPLKARRTDDWKAAHPNTSSKADPDFWKANEDLPAITLGLTGQRGGIIDVYNPLGKIVATVQCGKTNEGLIAVKNVNGDFSNGLVPK